MKPFLVFFVLPLFLLAQPTAYFHPPETWKEMDPRSLPSSIKIGYVGKGKKHISPSINLATEDITGMSQQEYTDLVKNLHKSNPLTSWRKLGSLKTLAGKAHLSEITRENPAGKIKMLQCILVKDKLAYVMTGGSSPEEFGALRKEFLSCFQSLTLSQDLLKDLNDSTKESKIAYRMEQLKKMLQGKNVSRKTKEKNLLDFYDFLSKECSEKGAYWRYLVVKSLKDA